MSVDVVLPALANIEDDITAGSLTAESFSAPPNSISGNLPCFVNLFGDSTVDMIAGGEDEKGIDVIETAMYTATLYAAPAGTGVSGEAFDKITPWVTPAAQAFLAHPNIAVTDGRYIILMKYLGHGRARGDLVYGGQQYFGVEFRLQVITKMRATYASSE